MREVEALPRVAQLILWLTSVLESYGASEWSYQRVASASFLIFLAIRLVVRKKDGLDIDAMVHALITGIGSGMCVYLNLFHSEALTGTREPLRMLRCEEPLTNLHALLPAVTLGYSVFDIVNGFTMDFSKEFLAHGVVTFFTMAFYCHYHIQPIVTQMLVLELSTILLPLCQVQLFGHKTQLFIQLSFALIFFLSRILLAPYIWILFLYNYHKEAANYHSCLHPSYTICITFFSGFFFHLLNFYWFYKIIRKAKRKLSGHVAVQDTKME